MKIKFLGAAGTVTGSSYILTSGSGRSILIDLGMFQGTTAIDALNYEPYEYDCSQLSGALLTHAHLDHCGRLPILYSHGYTGEVWMTPTTKDLTELSLLDSAKIAKQDGRTILYDTELVQRTIAQCRTVNYRDPIQVADFMVTFRDAGHILGSAILEIEDLQPDSEMKKIVFSGDLGNTPEELVMPTEMIDQADVVVMESTYGDRLHPQEKAIDALQAEINAVETNGGTLLLPAFSLERTQELLHFILHLKKEKKIHINTPVFLDSPMATRATNIYRKYVELFNQHIRTHFQKEEDPFSFPGLEVMIQPTDRDKISDKNQIQVIIAGSGMMTGGRILRHAAHYLSLPSTRLLLTGFQGEETLGRELEEGSEMVMIEDQEVPVQASVNITRAMSSHADQGQLLNWLGAIQGVKKVILTHGEDGPRTALKQKISEELGIADIELPVLHQELSV